MLFERAELQIKEGMEERFAAAMRERGIPLLLDVPGVHSVKMGRGIENASKFMLLVHWESLDAHKAFTKSPALQGLLGVIGPFSNGGAMEHFEIE